ncbi:hypothetical protein BV22DRAFT_368471 [Leucogyrophana mollusca]|uniref:Uncharacterized protein n=1 Tax=Leucogyrophana mollusca TaxID=85980 RepID=A0ACB8BK35_9AGAM|nr:hypothetical protein BV22DRAFT_368471 [Leucogyrophana mollusca]
MRGVSNLKYSENATPHYRRVGGAKYYRRFKKWFRPSVHPQTLSGMVFSFVPDVQHSCYALKVCAFCLVSAQHCSLQLLKWLRGATSIFSCHSVAQAIQPVIYFPMCPGYVQFTISWVNSITPTHFYVDGVLNTTESHLYGRKQKMSPTRRLIS